MDKIEREIRDLTEKLLHHQHLYYVRSNPEISDREYDALFDRLQFLEETYPQYADDNSPTKRVGVDLDNRFEERDHKIAVLSLDKAYTTDEILKWIRKHIDYAEKSIDFVIEEKLDGASIVLEYQKGVLTEALTRGNGIRGNVVTENVRTIKSVPLRLSEPIDLLVRGEIFIEKNDFERYNHEFDGKYSNPRNLASGSLRQLKSSLVSSVPLKMVAYEGYFEKDYLANNPQLGQHVFNLEKLDSLGFKISEQPVYLSENAEKRKRVDQLNSLFKTGTFDIVSDCIAEKNRVRNGLAYDIDGLVIKIDSLVIRESLGSTAHHPRWAIAFKFESPLAQTRLLDITIQVGRNGRVTPVAELEPVPIAGSVVSRATLHNLEYIETLEIDLGDTVSISKRGDIIPAVEAVLEKDPDQGKPYRFPSSCPFCDTGFVKEGAHHFCKNVQCVERKKRSIIYFASKGQMDIESLGDKTIEFLYDNQYIRSIPDLYNLDFDRLLTEDGFKEKKVQNIKDSIERSKSKPFPIVLSALGFDGLGKNRAADFIDAGLISIDTFIDLAAQDDRESLMKIDGVGDVLADSIISQFRDQGVLKLIGQLKEVGLIFSVDPSVEDTLDSEQTDDLVGQVWVITGTFDHFKPRSRAADEIKKRGGKVTSAVNSKTTHLLMGESPGSKLKKAEALNKQIVSESEFIKILGRDRSDKE